jgi:GTP-binding protein HflX
MNSNEDNRFLWSGQSGSNQSGHAKIRALLVGLFRQQQEKAITQEHLQELPLLAETQGIPVVFSQNLFLRSLRAATLLTEGKLEELKKEATSHNANLIIFDDEITPAQQRNLEAFFAMPVIDRTEVILGVFAMRAKSREAKLQIELAEVKYQLPRLKRLWTHLSRQTGGGGGASGGGYLKGEGEKQIEIDRRILKRRVEQLEKEISQIRLNRETQRGLREKTGVPVVAIVGYTNAGKSTLMNLLTQAGVYVEDKLFATLDTTTRNLTLPNNQEILLIDTVGFIRKLPHLLVAAFRSTLEEAVFADIILHVIDASHPMAQEQAKTSIQVLQELHANMDSMMVVFNKIDKLEAQKEQLALLYKLKFAYPRSLEISAKENRGTDLLKEEIMQRLQSRRTRLHLSIPQKEYHLVAKGLRDGHVLKKEYEGDHVLLELDVPVSQAYHFAPYKIGN